MARLHEPLAFVFTGLMGAGGVALLAAGAHIDASGRLTAAGGFLLFHAAAVLALATPERLALRAVRGAALLLVIGPVLFSGDIAVRVLHGVPLWPMIAPAGGSITIAGWLVLALGGAALLFSRPK